MKKSARYWLIGSVLLLGCIVPGWRSFDQAPHWATAEASGGAHVTVFITAWCAACRRHMRGLHERRIPYRTVDIEQEPARYEPIRERLGRTTVPVTIVERRSDRRWVVGVNPTAVARAYHDLSKGK